MNTKRIVITGGPGTGKTSIINELIRRNYCCLEEISRQITIEARKNGISQLFLSEPLLFSELLFKGRSKQFEAAAELQSEIVYLDRGLPDVVAYLDYKKHNYPNSYNEICLEKRYDHIFILAPWQDIYKSDNERYESFEQAIEIHDYLLKTYNRYNYSLHDVPFGSVINRTDFILKITSKL